MRPRHNREQTVQWYFSRVWESGLWAVVSVYGTLILRPAPPWTCLWVVAWRQGRVQREMCLYSGELAAVAGDHPVVFGGVLLFVPACLFLGPHVFGNYFLL